jgi:nitrile hydratase
MNPNGHTRLPVYLRGRPGRVLSCIGTFPLSDVRAAGAPADREPLYTVLFDARDVWGHDADATQTLTADLFESYLEAPA